MITGAASGPHSAVRELVFLMAAVPDAGDSMVSLMSGAEAQEPDAEEEGVTVRDDGLDFLNREAARLGDGTATSARLAVLAARGQIEDGAEFVNESVIDSRFVGRILRRTAVGGTDAIVPAIAGRAWITGVHQSCSTGRPVAEGFQVSNTWGAGTREALLGGSA